MVAGLDCQGTKTVVVNTTHPLHRLLFPTALTASCAAGAVGDVLCLACLEVCLDMKRLFCSSTLRTG